MYKMYTYIENIIYFDLYIISHVIARILANGNIYKNVAKCQKTQVYCAFHYLIRKSLYKL